MARAGTRTYRPARNQPINRGETRDMNDPKPCLCLMKAVKHGPLVPARIYWTDSEPGEPENTLDRGGKPFLAAEIAGRTVNPERVWHAVWEAEIDEAEYKFRLAEIEWLRKYKPDDPLANPWEPVRIAAIPMPFE